MSGAAPRTRVTREDWLRAARTVLVEQGVDLALRMGQALTVGSKYSSDVRRAKTMVLWGSNPGVTAPPFLHVIAKKADGGNLIVIDPVKEYFPTMGSGVLLHFEKRLERDSTDAIANGDLVKIITLDAEVGAYNVLGNWADAEDCYYYNDYLIGEDADDEQPQRQRPQRDAR